MEILLVQPSIRGNPEAFESSSMQLQPLTPGVVAALIPNEHKVTFVDDRMEPIPYQHEFDLVGITTTALTATRAYSIADEFRQQGTSVLIGGHHATLRPREAKAHADSVLIGEAEGILREILEDFQNGVSSATYQLEERPGPVDLTPPDREIYQDKDYLPVEMIETTRGCPHNCSFCSVSSFFGSGYRHRCVEEVVEEIKSLPRDVVFFVDDNIVGDPEYAKKLFRSLIPLNISWFGQASITMAWDEEILDLMKRSGCVGNLIGFESVHMDSLKEMNKGWNQEMPFGEVVDKIHSRKLAIYASFVLGLDSDRPSTVDETYQFAIKNKFLAAVFNYLTPYPGTEQYRKLRNEDRIPDEQWWLNDENNVVRFEPANFSRAELLEMTQRAKERYYDYKNIFRRALNFRGNLSSPRKALIYWGINKAFHDERYAQETSQK